MAKKPELTKSDETDETLDPETTDEVDEIPEPKPKPKTPKKPINIMDSTNSNEPLKGKPKDEPAIDLSPVIDEIKAGFAALAPKSTKTPKKVDTPESSSFDQDFLSPLGDW